jgi:hypothetical protein
MSSEPAVGDKRSAPDAPDTSYSDHGSQAARGKEAAAEGPKLHQAEQQQLLVNAINNGPHSEENQALAIKSIATLLEMQMLTASAPLQTPPWQLSRDPVTGMLVLYNATTGLVTCVSPVSPTAGGSAAGEGPSKAPSYASSVVAPSPPTISIKQFEDEVQQQLQESGEIFTWNARKKTIEDFKASSMWSSWIAAGHNEQGLVRFIDRLKRKHLDDACKQDTGEGVRKFEKEVGTKLNEFCGDWSKWNFKEKTMKNFREAEPFWTKVKRALLMLLRRLLSLVLMPQAKEFNSPTNACEISSVRSTSGPQLATANKSWST